MGNEKFAFPQPIEQALIIKERKKMVDLLLSDLRNEYTHMMFYLSSSSLIRGLHRRELREWLEEEAKSEMEHVKQFSRLLVSLGVSPLPLPHGIPLLTDAGAIIRQAIKLEQEVCVNYARRLDQVSEFKEKIQGVTRKIEGSVDVDEYAVWARVELFYEDQLTHSHEDLDELREWIREND
jgi:rubrerythrin